MALSDALGASGGDDNSTLDPASIVQSLIAQRAPDLAQNGSVDPQMVENRLIRGMLDRGQQRAYAKQQADAAANPDLTSFGKTQEEVGAPPDLSSFGQTADEASGNVPVSDSAAQPGILEAGWQGLKRGAQELGLSGEVAGSALANTVSPRTDLGEASIPAEELAKVDYSAPTPQPLPPETSPAAQPLHWGDLANPISQLLPKLAYGTGEGLPNMAAGAAGAVLGGVAGGPVGAVAGMGLAAGGMRAAQSIGPYYEDALKQTNGDQDKAYGLAVKNAAEDGVETGASYALFGVEPFQGFLKNLLFQGLAAQPGFAAATQIAKNLANGQPTSQGVGDATASAVLGTILPMAAMHLAKAVGTAAPGQPAETGAQPSNPDVQPSESAGGLPPPDEGAAGAAAATAGPQPNAGPGGAGAQTEPPQPFASNLNPKVRSTLETQAVNAGLSDAGLPDAPARAWGQQEKDAWTAQRQKIADDVASWPDQQLYDYLHQRAGGGAAPGGTPQQAPDEEILRRYGFSDEEIAGMSPDDKRANVDEALKNGTPAGQAPPVDLKTTADVQRASAQAQPTAPGQPETTTPNATWNGLGINIEVPPGGTRTGTTPGPSGKPWQTTHQDAYGHFIGLPPAADKMAPDVIVGPHPSAPDAFVLDETNPKTGAYRQSKAFVGFHTWQDAVQSYLGISSKTPGQIGGMRAFSREDFVNFVRAGGLSKPSSDAVTGKAGKGQQSSPKSAPVYNVSPGMEPGAPKAPGGEPPGENKPQAVFNSQPSPDQPTAEPISDIAAQIADLKDPKNPRQAVWLPASSVAHARAMGITDADEAKGLSAIHDFDGKGGTLLTRNQDTAEQAVAAVDKGEPLQSVIGRLTGAGTGKPAGATAAVQQRDQAGNVTRERAVTPDQIAATTKEFTAPGRTVHTMTPAQALTRRAPLVMAERNGQEAPAETEPTPADHRAIEDALRQFGVDRKNVRAVDVARAAEIHAQEGFSPQDAWQLAIVRSAVEDGLLTPAQVKEQYGAQIAALLEPHGTPERGVRAQTQFSPADRPPAATGTPANERIPGGGANGKEAAQPAQSAKPAGDQAGRGNGQAAATGHPANGGANQQRPTGGERNAGANERGAEHQPAAAAKREAPKAAGAPLIGDRVTSIPEHTVTAADGTKVKVAPVVVEAKDLITSSDEGYDKDLQPRQRERAASQAQIREIATRLDPERLGYSAEADRGAPIVGPDKMVESGNGRVAAIRAVYAHNPKNAAKYRAWLKGQGVDAAKYKEPILVRQRVSDLDQKERENFAVAANQAATLSMSAPERAMADAGNISPQMLDLLKDGDLNNLENRKFIRTFIGELPATERGALTSKEGGLSAEGLTRVRNAILAKAYGDPDIVSRITESTDDDIKSISNALTAAAPAWAKLRADIDQGNVRRDLDLTGDLMEAVKRTADLKTRGQNLADHLAQADAFDDLKGPVEGFMRWFYDPKGKRVASAQSIAGKLRFYAEQAAKVSNDPDLGLDIPKVKADEIQRLASAKAEDLQPGGGAGVRASVEAGGEEIRGRGTGERGAEAPAEQLSEPGSKPTRRSGLGRGLAESDNNLRPTERTHAGEQYILPGAERVSSAELAKRRAAERLKPKKEQKPANEGLFASREGKQADLEEAIAGTEPPANKREPGFRSEPGQPYSYRDLGPFDVAAGEAIGKKAQEYVVRLGREINSEVLVAFDGKGNLVAHGRGATGNVGLSPQLMEALLDPRRDVVVHHNHPSDSGLSLQDIVMLAYPGSGGIWAHGHDGSVSHAELRPEARRSLGARSVRRLDGIGMRVDGVLAAAMQNAVDSGRLTTEEANAVFHHVAGIALRDAGVIDYHSNIDAATVVSKAGLQPLIDELADNISKEMFGHARARLVDRRAAPLRERPGNVGTSFERDREIAGKGSDENARAETREERGGENAGGPDESTEGENGIEDAGAGRLRALGYEHRDDGRAAALRHPGELGAAFGQTRTAAEWHALQVGNDSERQEANREEEGNGEAPGPQREPPSGYERPANRLSTAGIREGTDVAPTPEEDQGIASADEDWRRNHIDLGPYEAKEGVPLGRQSQDYVVARGRATGNEHLLAFGEKGDVIAHGYGGPRNTGMKPALEAALRDPNGAVVVHHNHPGNSGLSDVDLSVLAAPGAHAIWAHGHEGTVARAALTPAARQAFSLEGTDQAVRRLHWLASGVTQSFLPVLQRIVKAGYIDREEGHLALTHLVARSLDRAGIIDYRSNVELPKAISESTFEPYIQRAAQFAAGRLFNDYVPAQARADRRAEPLRHIGELGTSLERPSELARRYAAQERSNQESGANDRAEEAARPQLAFAENAPRAPPFYSAVAEAVAAAKQEKASPNQWLGMLKNAGGVKPEEMKWLGLEDWLKQQKGPVTKQAIADYVRANQVEVKGIEKGRSGLTPAEQREIEELRTRERTGDIAHLALSTAEWDRLGALEHKEAYGGETKFGQYTLPGGENYRELLLTLPPKVTEINHERLADLNRRYGRGELSDTELDERDSLLEISEKNQAARVAYKSSHWDEPNVLAHVRFDDRTIDGKRTLHIAEIQSDWHQKGRKLGYQQPPVDAATRARLLAERDQLSERAAAVHMEVNKSAGRRSGEEFSRYMNEALYGNPAYVQPMDRISEINEELGEHTHRVPDAPFKTTWPELSLKRMVRYAAENGYDQLSWDSGETNAERYDLSKQIDRLYFNKNRDGTFDLSAELPDGTGRTLGLNIAPEKLPDYIGKEVADHIVRKIEDKVEAQGSLQGLDLKVGGEGMRGFYDQILPAAAAKLTKKFGAKVGVGELVQPPIEKAANLANLTDAQWAGTDPETRERLLSQPAVTPRQAKAVHTLDITPQLREAAVHAGFPLFEGRNPFEGGFEETPPKGTKGFHHNQPPEDEHVPRGEYQSGRGKKPPNGGHGSPGDPLGTAGNSIRGHIANMLGSEGLLAAKEKLQDYNARVEHLQNMIEARSHGWVSKTLGESPLPDNQQFYALKRLFPGKRDNVRREFYGKYFLPLRDLIRDSGMTVEEAGDYLQYKHAPERNMNVGKLYPGPTLAPAASGNPISGQMKPAHPFNEAMRDPNVVGGSGMSTKAALDGAHAMENGPKGWAFRELAKRVADIRQFIHGEMYRGSLESKETLSEWNRSSPNYVPLRGWEDPAEAPQFANTGKPGRGGGDIRGPESQRALGRRTKADNPVVALLDQAYRTIDRAEMNLALHSLARMVNAAGPEVRKEMGITLERGRPKRTIDQTTGLVKTVDDNFDRMRTNAVHMKVNGKDQYVVFADQKLADAVKRWSPYTAKPLALLNRLMSKWKSALTHYNPLFMPRHMARYYVEGLLNSFEQMEHGAFSPAQYAKDAFPLIGPATRAIFLRERGQDAGELGRHWDLMKANGGATSLFSMRDYDELLDRLSKDARALGRSAHDPRELLAHVTEAVDRFTSMIDNSTRLAAFSQAIKAGKTPQQASLIAREATVDYNLKGYWSNMLGVWAPFQNVATQTGYRMYSAQSRSSIMRKVFLGTMALGMATGIWNYMFGGDDKDKTPFFDKIPPWTRSKSIAMYLGMSDDKGRPQPFMWPMPFNYAFPWTAGLALAGMFFGDPKKHAEQMAMVGKSFLSTLSEIGEEGIHWSELAPQLIRPFFDVAFNESWTGGMIHRDSLFQKGPNSQSGFPDTPTPFKAFAKFLNSASGGNTTKAGYLDIYPEDLEYFLNAYLGGQERFGADIANIAAPLFTGAKLDPTKIPVGSIFYGTDYDKANAAAARQRAKAAKQPWLH